MPQNDRRKAIETLGEMIRDMPVAMLTTSPPDHTLHSRPMVNVNQKFEGDLWFFTNEDDPKVHEIVGNPQVNVSFASPSDGRYVSISGQGSLVKDKKRAELLWTGECRKWFREGPSDKLALLKIDVERAEYWDEQSGGMVTIAGFFKRVVTGDRPYEVEHESIDWSKRGESAGSPASDPPAEAGETGDWEKLTDSPGSPGSHG